MTWRVWSDSNDKRGRGASWQENRPRPQTNSKNYRNLFERLCLKRTGGSFFVEFLRKFQANRGCPKKCIMAATFIHLIKCTVRKAYNECRHNCIRVIKGYAQLSQWKVCTTMWTEYVLAPMAIRREQPHTQKKRRRKKKHPTSQLVLYQKVGGNIQI